MKLVFGDIVVVDEGQIGVVVKCWGRDNHGNEPKYEVYVRSYNAIREYSQSEVQRYQVRHKYLNEDELEYQRYAEAEE